MFSDAIVNADAPFVTKLREKHNAMERKSKGGLRIIDEVADGNQEMWLNDQESIEQEHPYLYELDHFSVPTHQFTPPRQEKVEIFYGSFKRKSLLVSFHCNIYFLGHFQC